MSNDYQKKQPTKTERLLYEMAMRMEMTDRNMWSNSAHLCALGILLDVKPEKVAELLVNGGEQIAAYGKAINEEAERLEALKKESSKKDDTEAVHDHNHNHTH